MSSISKKIFEIKKVSEMRPDLLQTKYDDKKFFFNYPEYDRVNPITSAKAN